MKRRQFLRTLGFGSLASMTGSAVANAQAPAPGSLSSTAFHIELDLANGSLKDIRQPADPTNMNWISAPANAPWQTRSWQWGLGYADLGKASLHRGRWEEPVEIVQSGNIVRIYYRLGALKVEVTRELSDDVLVERYAFTNMGTEMLPMTDKSGTGLAIYTPFNDHYTNTADVLEHRCHAHIWTGGTSSWVATRRMGGRGPHLGLVLTEGALLGYSISGRDTITSSNTRGTFMLHPAINDLKPGETRDLSWTLFWYEGWDDFFGQCARHSNIFVKVEASAYTVYPGETLDISIASGSRPTLKAHDKTLDVAATGKAFKARFKAEAPGETVIRVTTDVGVDTRLVINVAPDLNSLMAARVNFIVDKQQFFSPADPRDGAFVLYDNQLQAQVTTDKFSDRNEGRERLGMGVFLARWLRQTKQASPKVTAALETYRNFVTSRLQKPDGFVFNSVSNHSARLYNWPWVAQLHLETARLNGSEDAYDWFVRTVESFYANGGDGFYPIGMPVHDGLTALKVTGRKTEYDKLLALFTAHGDKLAATGTNYPASEVNYEQSIVAPAAIFLLELHRATGKKAWLKAAKPHMDLLELFNGRQPDHHLYEVAIRHWDGYWFGKSRMWGDTFPHYWSSLTGLAYAEYSRATKDKTYFRRAEDVLRNNLSLFNPDGTASAAFIYPDSVNGQAGRFADAYANDQDWALVHMLQAQEI